MHGINNFNHHATARPALQQTSPSRSRGCAKPQARLSPRHQRDILCCFFPFAREISYQHKSSLMLTKPQAGRRNCPTCFSLISSGDCSCSSMLQIDMIHSTPSLLLLELLIQREVLPANYLKSVSGFCGVRGVGRPTDLQQHRGRKQAT